MVTPQEGSQVVLLPAGDDDGDAPMDVHDAAMDVLAGIKALHQAVRGQSFVV